MESITLYCRTSCDDQQSLESRLSLLDPASVTCDASEGMTCPSYTVRINGEMSVVVNRCEFTARADRFSKLINGTLVFFERRIAQNAKGADQVISHIRTTKCIIGIVADPELDAIPRLTELIRFLAIEYDAYIFDGSEMLDFLGNAIA